MVRVFLTRHGQTFENEADRINRDDSILTPTGKFQGINLAEIMKQLGVRTHYSSDLDRNRQMMGIFKRIDPTIRVEFSPGLREVDYGDMKGMTKEDVTTLFPEFYRKDVYFEFPEGNSVLEAAVNTSNDLDRILARHYGDPEPINLHIHSGTIRSVFAYENLPKLAKLLQMKSPQQPIIEGELTYGGFRFIDNIGDEIPGLSNNAIGKVQYDAPAPRPVPIEESYAQL